ncbi:MAG TPA: YoaK family protein [Stellaceae bacterium]
MAKISAAPQTAANDASDLSGIAGRLPPLLSVIAGMVDLTGFFTLGNIFTAHITGNLVLSAAAVVRGGPLNLAQMFAIPVFMFAVSATWLIARTCGRHGLPLVRLLLEAQFLLLAVVLIFSILTKPSTDPHGLTAGITAMIAVAAMACQYALLRLALPKVVSTAVMTGNLTNAVLSLMEAVSRRGSLAAADMERLRGSLRLLFGFLIGCLVAAGAVSFGGEWAWSLPVALAAVAIVLR